MLLGIAAVLVLCRIELPKIFASRPRIEDAAIIERAGALTQKRAEADRPAHAKADWNRAEQELADEAKLKSLAPEAIERRTQQILDLWQWEKKAGTRDEAQMQAKKELVTEMGWFSPEKVDA
jgi:hypothetical protein